MKNDSWNIDVTHTALSFSVRHMLVSKVRGRFGKFAGTITLDDGDITRSSATVSIDASSIDTGVVERDTHLRSPDFLDVEKFPELGFRSQRIERVDDTHYRVVGELMIRDVKRGVTLDVEYGGRGKDPWGNERVGFVARTSIDRKEFGLTWNQMLETGGVLVGERVDIELDVQAVRVSAEQAA
jgi:polyisoprenoid-binding protein YceI